MKRKDLVRIAKQEIATWDQAPKVKLPQGLVMAILFSFVHRVTTGETVEETFFKEQSTVEDYEI